MPGSSGWRLALRKSFAQHKNKKSNGRLRKLTCGRVIALKSCSSGILLEWNKYVIDVLSSDNKSLALNRGKFVKLRNIIHFHTFPVRIRSFLFRCGITLCRSLSGRSFVGVVPNALAFLCGWCAVG